jgi:hypothetical protein
MISENIINTNNRIINTNNRIKMKTSKKLMLLCAVVIFAASLVSWDHRNTTRKKSITSWSYLDDKNFTELTEAETGALIAEDDGFKFSPEPAKPVPPAEDVLIQRIPGDNNHLLMMAFYSKENYSGQFVTIENGGSTLVFRDDGKEYDKKAGDGLYTARISADVNEFRQKSQSMNEAMKRNGYKPFHFVNRSMVMDPDISENFEAEKMDRNEPVSIAALTNALSSDLVASDSTLNKIRKNCMVITNVAVVEDPTRTWNSCKQTGNVSGPWTFGTLIRQLASKSPSAIATDVQVSDFVKNWLNTWATKQIINGDTVAARVLVNSKILDPWQNKSGSGKPLNMKFAPFKLIAIVNRFDLRGGAFLGIPGSPCGEGRFVFCLINSNCAAAMKMTVIFEFGINKPSTCTGRNAWALQWYNLKNLTQGTSQYNQALQNITDQFTLCGSNPSKPNQSSLDRLRTNEIVLSPTPQFWELREFLLNASGDLEETTVVQNPADKYDAQVVNANVTRLAAYVNQNSASILNGSFSVPLTWQGFPFLGGSAHILKPPTGTPPKVFHWDGTSSSNTSTFIKNNGARAFFSFNTCAGCHAGESQTFFTHVDPVFYGKEATLSGFLTGTAGIGGAIDFDNKPANDTMAVEDAALRPTATNPGVRFFNDILRRAKGLKTAAETPCGAVLGISAELMFEPTNMTD